MSNKNALQGANVRTSSISLRTPATKQTQSTPGRMVNTQKSPPWACDKGAQKLAQNVFPPWRGDHVNSVPDLAASPPPPTLSSSKQKCYFAVRVAVIDFVRILRLRFSFSVSFSSICSCQRVLECIWKRLTEEYPAAKLLNWLNTRFE